MIASIACLQTAPCLAQTSAETPSATTDTSQDSAGGTNQPSRLFGVLPNESTIEAGTPVGRVTTRQTFTFATQDSFDKNVFPFVGVVAFFGVGQPSASYGRRYVTAFADNTISNYLTTAVLPHVFQQDPRYFQLGTGSFLHRAAYAATRGVITRSRDGAAQFNVSEIGGSVLASIVGSAYYPPPQQAARAVLARAGSQVLWDTVSYECKEFWPDIRAELERIFRHHHE